MKNVLVLGAGKIGLVISDLLAHSGDYRVTLGDTNPASLQNLPAHPNLRPLLVDVADPAQLKLALQDKFAVISACPFQLTATIASAAAESKVHYLDLTEDVASTRCVKALAEKVGSALIPQCGLAPGFISIAAHHLAKRFDRLHDLHMRVGALPQFPSNALKYNLTWSTEGLINEYCNPCEAVVDGELIQVPALEEIESFSLDGITYEAFNTSGGLGTLCDTWAGKVRNMNYRTVRYPGHRDAMKMLLHDLRLKDRQELLKDILESALPVTYQDVVLVFISANGYRDNRFIQESYVNKIYARDINGQHRSAIQITTSSSVCAVLDLLANGKLPTRGFVRQEDIDYNDFINNRFGVMYVSGDNRASARQVA